MLYHLSVLVYTLNSEVAGGGYLPRHFTPRLIRSFRNPRQQWQRKRHLRFNEKNNGFVRAL